MQNSAQAAGDLPRIGVTMGDPAGIGPEVVLKAVAEAEVQAACQPVIIGDAQLLARTGFRLARAVALDLMPQTYHVEVVALFQR